MKRAIICFILLTGSLTLFAQVDTLRKSPPKVFMLVEQMPEFPGGDAALLKFLQNNIQYPSLERDNDIQGRVIVGFTVFEDGTVGDVNVKRGVSKGLDEEAVRVVKKLPNFKPGKQQGKPVNVYYSLPIVYKLTSDVDPIVTKINPQVPFSSPLSGAAIAGVEKGFSDCFKSSTVKERRRSITMVVDFSLNSKGGLAAFKVRSGGGV
ncbi:MAG: energy transducer TonB, partial [Chitinophagales bacterium]|nr:energy transducer TonB [Chitinophagales bacterium]